MLKKSKSSKKSKNEEMMKKFIENYFSKKSALVIENITMNRNTLKSFLSSFGMNQQKIHFEKYYDDAKKYILQNKPEVIITNVKLDKKSVEDLLELHMEVIPNRLNACFFVVSDDRSPSAGTMALDSEIDSVFVTPFTMQSLEQAVVKTMGHKIRPNPYFSNIEESKEYILKGDLEKAYETLKDALDLNKNPVMAKSLMGKVKRLQKDYDEAEEVFLDVRKMDEFHYLTLRELSNLYEETKQHEKQYRIACEILENYPLNPKDIPALTRLSIQNSKYDDVLNLNETFSKIKYVNDIVTEYLAAGLAICGRFFLLEKEEEKGVKTLMRSAQLSKGKVEILSSIVSSFLSINREDEASQVLTTYRTKDTNESKLSASEFEIICHSSASSEVLEEGLKLLGRGIQERIIYENVIKVMKEQGIDNQKREDIESEALRLFPDIAV